MAWLFSIPLGEGDRGELFCRYLWFGIERSQFAANAYRDHAARARRAETQAQKKSPDYEQKVRGELAACQSDSKQCWSLGKGYEHARDFESAMRFYGVCCDAGDNLCCSQGESVENRLHEAAANAPAE